MWESQARAFGDPTGPCYLLGYVRRDHACQVPLRMVRNDYSKCRRLIGSTRHKVAVSILSALQDVKKVSRKFFISTSAEFPCPAPVPRMCKTFHLAKIAAQKDSSNPSLLHTVQLAHHLH